MAAAGVRERRVGEVADVERGVARSAGVAARERLQAVEQGREAREVALDVGEHALALAGRVAAVERRVERRAQLGQRRAQLVPGVGREAPRGVSACSRGRRALAGARASR